MKEKKILMIGVGIAIAGAFAISWFTTYGGSKKDEDLVSQVFGGSMAAKEYDLNVMEKKTISSYKPLDMSEIEKKFAAEKSEKSKKEVTVTKTEEVKDESGAVVAKKEYKSDGTLDIINFKGNKKIYTETTKEKKGKYEGESVAIYTDGTKQTYTYKNGVKEGAATIEFSNGDKEIYSYKNGIPEGEGTYYFVNGDREEYVYKNGLMEGPAKYIYANGRIDKYNYENGERK